MKFVILGLLVVLVIGFFVLVWKAAKNWRWYQITPVSITMLLAILFLFPTAGVLKSRSEWHKVKEKLEKQATEVVAEQRLLEYGDPTNPAAGPGVSQLTQQLSRLGIEAGRRWRNLQLQNAGNNQVILGRPAVDPNVAGIPDADPGEGEDPAPALALIPEGLVVYGFAETPNQKVQALVPTFYLGEFVVSASTPTQATLVPTGPLAPAQLQAISSGQARSWSAYEMLPLDSREAFVAEGSVSNDDNYLGRVDEELVKSLLGNSVSPETLSGYLRDGSRATQDDPPLSRWSKIEFLKPHTVEVDSMEQRGALDGGYFDASGRAVDGRLQRGEDNPLKFAKGDQILVKEEVADGLRDEGIAKLIDSYYLRPLNDYQFVLRHIRLRLAELENRKAELLSAKAVLDEAIEKSNGMLVANQDIKVKLEQDFAQFRTEKEAIVAYTTEAKATLESMRTEMARLHQQNVTLEQRLDEIHRSIEAGVDSFTSIQ